MKQTSRLLVIVLSLSLLLVSWSGIGLAQPAADEPVVQPDFGATAIGWNAPQGSGAFILVVSGPDGYRFEQTFQSGTPLAFQAVDATGAALADGLYKYELTPVRYDLTKARSAGDDGRNPAETRELVQSQANLNANLAGISGVFTIQNGAILDPNAVEEDAAAAQPQQADSPAGIDAPADVIHADDVIIQSSLCVGFDCVNGESFGFDTIRLKENNLRIKAQDTSNSGSFPSRDWQLTFNDSSNGGANKFSIDDIDGGRTPFTIEAGAPSHSLYVDDGGRIGMGTSSPVVEVHVVDGDTPTLRLQQDGSSGFGQLTWDIAGNETNFFVRDVTNGSKLPFKIFPNAPTNSLVVEGSSGDVGMGAGTSPSASLHVKRTDGTAQILVEDTAAPSGTVVMVDLKSKAAPQIRFDDTDDAVQVWRIGMDSVSRFNITLDSTGGSEFLVDTSGNATVRGTLTVNSGTANSCTGCRRGVQLFEDRNSLAALNTLPLLEFSTIQSVTTAEGVTEDISVDHITPDAEAFRNLFGYGITQGIAPLDVATVALAATQALNQQAQVYGAQISSLQSQVSTLQEQNAALEARLAALEAALGITSPDTAPQGKSSIFVPSVQR